MGPNMKDSDRNHSGVGDMGIELRGFACRMPSSESTWKFWENLKNGVNMITVSDDHWEAGICGNLPMGKGYMANQEFFDNLFFKMSGAQASKVDPQLRFLLELSYEALVDAGFTDLRKLHGSKTAVYVGSCFSDCHKGWLNDVKEITGYENTGCAQSMYANRLSFFYDFAGPSMNIDTACSSSLVALVEAVNVIELGKADMAIVAGASVTLHPGVSIGFNRMQMLSADSACQSFSKNANGYARSEGVAVVVLTKENCELVKQCIKEPYAKLVGAGCNSDGFTAEGITFPNGDAQYRLYSQVREEAGISIFDVDYIEAHGTGTQAGDGQEMEALSKAYCPDERIAAQTGKPLLLGSVKSNMGHSEGCSGLAGLVKVLLSYEQRMIPANLHYKFEERNPKCKALNDRVNGVKVVEENTAFKDGGLIAQSSFGFGGTNAHILIRGGPSIDKAAELKYPLITTDAQEPWKQISPICARNEKCARSILEFLKEKGMSFENAISCPEVNGGEFPCHAYVNGDGEILTEQADSASKLRRPIWYIFSGNGAMWPRMGYELYTNSEIYCKTWDHCNEYLKMTYNCNSLDKFFREGPEVYDVATYTAIDGNCGLAAVQCALINIMKSLGIEADHMVGHSAGETAMGYADNLLNLEQTMDVAYWRGYFSKHSVSMDNPGAMYACGLPLDKIEALFKKHNIADASIACVNDSNMMTLSGSIKGLKPLLNELKDMPTPNGKPVFVRRLETFGIAYHSSQLDEVLPSLREHLRKVITNPKKRSNKWISTCVDDEILGEYDPLRYLSADYHCTNFREKVEFQRALSKCPENAIIIEIGPHSLFRGSAKKNVGTSHTYLSPMLRDTNSLHVFQHFYTQLWANSVLAPGGKTLTPTEAFPGGENRLIRQKFFNWDHSIKYPLPTLNDMMRNTGLVGGGSTEDGGIPIEFDFEENDKWMLDHVIDESVLFPGCGYLYAAWKAFQIHTHRKELADGIAKQDLSPVTDVVISKLKIPQGVRLDDSNRQLALSVKFNTEEEFEITYGGELIATGQIKILKLPKGVEKPANGWPIPFDDSPITPTTFGDPLGYIEKHTFYNRVSRNGYNYRKEFQLVEALDVDDSWAVVKFHKGYLEDESISGLPRQCDQVVANKFWTSYLDNLLQVNLYKGLEDSTTLRVPTDIREVIIRGSNFYKCFPKKGSKSLQTVDTESTIGSSIPSPISTCVPDNVTADPLLTWGSGNNVFVKIQKHCNKVTSCLADISGLQMKILARASLKKRAANTEVMTGKKLFFPLGAPQAMEMKSVDDAVQVMFEYVRLNLGIKNINLLDIDSTKFLGTNIVAYNGLDDLFVKFSEKFPAVKKQYEKNFAGLYSEYTTVMQMEGKFNFLMCSSNAFYNEDDQMTAEAVKRPMQVPVDMTEFSSFAMIHEDTELGGNETPSDEQFTKQLGLIPVMRIVVGQEKLTLVKIPEAREEGVVFLNLMQKKTIGKGLSYDLTGETMTNIIRPKIQSLIENSQVNRLFIVSNSDGFSGLLKCLQSEPGDQMKICGVWVHNLPTTASLPDQITAKSMKSGPGTEAISQLSANTLKQIEALGSQIVRVDATTGSIESELRCKSTSPTTFPAPHGVFTVFPNPGQLDDVAFKAQPEPQTDKERVKIAYSALNFRDIMLAYGKLDKDCLVGYSKNGDGWGLEYAGRVMDKDGKPGRRVVGLSTNCIGTEINVAKNLLFDLKDDQDMSSYATVPCVYSTSYYSLLVRAKMQPHESVLIHAGTGGVGQSALHISLRRTKDPSLVFTTCSAKKRAYLLKKFGPLGLHPENIGNSRDTSFEELIMDRTRGRGVDIVLNSLDGESLQASWRCVAPFGRFCEIGKYDLMQNTGLPMQVFLKNISFLGIDLDQIMDMPEEWSLIHKLVADGIQSGEVQPLDRKIFEANEVTEAFRFMGAGTHVGKVLIKFGSEDCKPYEKEPKKANIPNFSLNNPANHAFLIIGGLGGFGLEFAQWCSKHDVKKIILSSRGRVRNGNQARAIKEMQSHGCDVEICNADFTQYENVKKFLGTQPLAGFFNLGAVLADGLWKNMTPEGWETPCHAKTAVTDNFDRALRAANLKIDYFVTWSSVSAGHGNAGQTNYGYANSALDAIVRRRNIIGESALSIQWGAIADVGLLAKEDSKSSGNVAAAYMSQPMASCLAELEKLLAARSQGVHEVYVSPKRTLGDEADGGSANLPLKVAGIIGMANNMAEIENTPFENLGVDSLQVMEIQNSIKKAIGQKIAVDKLNKLTLKKLEDLATNA